MARSLPTAIQRETRPAPSLRAALTILAAAFIVFAQAGPASAQASPASPASGPNTTELPFTAPAPTPAPAATSAPALPAAPAPVPATVVGTVLDTNDNVVPGATIAVATTARDDRHAAVADDNAAFQINGLKPGIPYVLTVSARGFLDWTSQPVVFQPGQFLYLREVRLKVLAEATSITVYASSEQVATEQIHLEEQQRVLGFVPNYYVSYDGANAAPLSSKMKFQLAAKTATDPVTIAGVVFLAAVDQAADTPNYQEGAAGYGERFGSIGAEGASNILIGGAILPSLLHQDPRYFYQGSGSTRSRVLHAISAPFIARGDNGRNQINVSSMGGDLAAGALATTWLPPSNRDAGEVFGEFGLATGERVVNALAQEFILPRLTSRGKSRLPQP